MKTVLWACLSAFLAVSRASAEPRDRTFSGPELTASDQGENKRDLETTRTIRRGVVTDDALSVSAHNVKIITVGGKVTLKGTVESPEERVEVARKAANIAGEENVENLLEVR